MPLPFCLYTDLSSQANPMTRDQILQTAHVITWDCFTPSMIRDMHRTGDGAAAPRPIIRDHLEGADKIANAPLAKL